MFRLIVEKELREIISSTKFAVTFLAGAVLILLAFYVGARNFQVSRAQHETALTENLRKMEGLTEWARVEQRIFLPPQPLSALVTGVANDIGRNIHVEGQGDLTAEDSRFNDDPIFAVFRFLDLDFVFQIVLSLFAILFLYDSINGEKQQGTLRLVFSNAVPRDIYILGKGIGAFLALALPLLLPILTGCLLLALMGIPMTGDEWLRLGLVVLAGLLFLGVFLTLSLFVSALTHRPSSSFLILLVSWLFAVLIIPRVAVLTAGRAVEVVSTDEIVFEKSQFRAQLWEEDKKRLSGFRPAGTTREEMLRDLQHFMQQVGEERAEKLRRFNERLAEQRRNQEAAQRRLAFGLARISPVAAFSLAATNLAGTSIRLKEHYLEQALAYQQAFARFMREKTGGLPSGDIALRIMNKTREAPAPIDPHELPAFVFAPRPLKDVIRAALPDLGILCLFIIVFFSCAFVAFLRYDLR